MPNNNDELIKSLMNEVVGDDDIETKEPEQLVQTINSILHDYNLSTDLSFVERIAKMKINSGNNNQEETISLEEMPQELKDAAFLPVNTIADIALRQDLDLIISQIPEWFAALQVTRDAVCESDIVTGKLARTITFDKSDSDDTENENLMAKIEEVEERLDLHSLIKNHMVFNTLQYGEGYIYVIPYSKVFEDLYKYRLNTADKKVSKEIANMFETSSILNGYGYHEHAVEKTLLDTVITDATPVPKKKKGDYKRKTDVYVESAVDPVEATRTQLFTEQEIQEIRPWYHKGSPGSEKPSEVQNESDKRFDEMLTAIASNISYVSEDIALPVIEQSAYDLKAAYETKYSDTEMFVQEVTLFEEVMNQTVEKDEHGMDPRFSKIKGVYTRVLPATKLIPIRIDRVVIGYYYISDLTRPEQAGERKNSGLHGYSLRTPSVGYDTFSPDQMFCEKLASKIINNFDLKFMRDNTAIHQQIVAILQSHKFNESMMRFVFIPAEHVIQCTINKDGMGKGHSMLEPGLITARMYMFLKLYSILYQINNSQIRVYNLRMSGIDKNYKQFVQDTMRKFAARRVTANDIFNYRSSMTKVSGGSELVMPLGPGDKAPISVESIPQAEAPINNDLLEASKNESINASPVPSALVQGAMSELDFAKEVELANTRMASFVSSLKIDMNPDITRLYRIVLRWETDIDPSELRHMRFAFRMATAKQLSVTSEMLNNFNALFDLASQTYLTKEEQKEAEEGNEDDGGVLREYKKLLIAEYLGSVESDRLEQLADEARKKATTRRLKQTNKNKNMLEDVPEGEEMM